MPTNEARELTLQLREQLDLNVSHLVVNQIQPEHFPQGSATADLLSTLEHANDNSDLDEELAALATHGQLGRDRRVLNEHYLKLISQSLTVPHAQIPRLFTPSIGPEEIDHISHTLETAFGEPA